MSGAPRLTRVKYAAAIKGGAGFPHDEQDLQDEELPFYKVASLEQADSRGVLGPADHTISRTTAARLGAHVFGPNTVVFAKVGAALLLNRFRQLAADACLDNNMMGLEAFAEVADPRYLLYAMSSKDLSVVVNPGAVPSVNGSQVAEERVWLPQRTEQERIANFLDEQTARIDALIAEKVSLVELLEEQRQAWLSAELFDKMPYRVTRLKFCLLTGLQYGATESGDSEAEGPRYIRITDIRPDGTLSGEDAKFLTEEQAAPYLLHHNDVLFARSGATVGKSFLYLSEMGRCAYAGYLIRAKLRSDVLVPQYLRLLTETHQYWAYLRGAETQSTIQNASADKYANFSFPLPPFEVQKATMTRLAERLEIMACLVEHTREHIDRLREYRSSLISAAVTGQLDIATFKEAA